MVLSLSAPHSPFSSFAEQGECKVSWGQTSNQRLVYEQMISPENREIFLKTAKELKDQGWEAVLNRMVRHSDASSLKARLTSLSSHTECTYMRQEH